MMKLLSWNVNGIRAAERKGFLQWIDKRPANVVAVQETKVFDPGVLSPELRAPDGYEAFWNSHEEKKGYSGVALYTTTTPKTVRTDFGKNLLSKEGRMIEADFGDFVFINIYFPNGGQGPHRLQYKLQFYDEFLAYVKGLVKKGRRVVFCGDVNTAHREIDLARPKENETNTGFLPIERKWIDRVISAGFIDTFRKFHPDEIGAYSYWDMKTFARDRNVGWRIDYFFVSANMEKYVKDAFILSDVYGSDHCPVGITVGL